MKFWIWRFWTLYLYISSNSIIAMDVNCTSKELQKWIIFYDMIYQLSEFSTIPILNVLLGRAETQLCWWWARVKVVATELLKRFVMSARGTLLGFCMLCLLFLKDVGMWRIETLLVLYVGGTLSLLSWSDIIMAVSLFHL